MPRRPHQRRRGARSFSAPAPASVPPSWSTPTAASSRRSTLFSTLARAGLFIPRVDTLAASPRGWIRGAQPSSQPPPVLIIVARQLRMEDVEEHRFYLPGAAEPHFQVHERRVARFEVAERIGGGSDLVGLRSKPPFIGGTSEGKRSVHFLLSTQKRGAARAAPKLEAALGLGGLGGAAYCKRIGTSAWARRSVRGGLTSTYILFTLAAMVENVIKTAGSTWQSRPSRRRLLRLALFRANSRVASRSGRGGGGLTPKLRLRA